MEDRYCPNCGRYVGSLEVCPYCGTKIPKHTGYYYAKYGALTFALIGIVLLLIFAQNVPVQYVHIKDISQTYNYGTVEIKGIVSSAPSLIVYKEGSATLYIDVDDGTGIMSVHVYSPTVEKLAKADKLPGYGEYVDVIGEVYIRGSNIYMIVNSPEEINIIKPKPVQMSIADINSIEYPYAKYVRVELNATVLKVHETSRGSYVLNITDGTGYMDMYLPYSVVYFSNMDVKSLEGKKINVVGSIEWYGSFMNGYWELIPSSINDIKVIG